jgi:hypothetical protein
MRIALVAAAFAASMAGSVAFSFSEGVSAETIVGNRAFSFVALGDMPYDGPADHAKFDRLIGAINALKPAFSVHVGDIKGGGSACTDASFNIIYSKFQSFDGALVYTPGDNEWTDCHRIKGEGIDDPRERLSKLREIFFAKSQQSLGKQPIAVENEGQTLPKYGKFVENVRFGREGVLFVTLNIPGSNNGSRR